MQDCFKKYNVVDFNDIGEDQEMQNTYMSARPGISVVKL